MHYVSTRDNNTKLTAAAAIARGLSRDGGLLTPEVFPKLPEGAIKTLQKLPYAARAVFVMKLFLEEFSEEELQKFAALAYGGGKFDDPRVAPVYTVDETTYCLELWHGPTSAFKDMALQMLPHLLTASLVKSREEKQVCILVATSGDTGKAALEGFRDAPRSKILVFYPQDGVSAIQGLQMQTQEGANVGVCAVTGNFDDAQSGVKAIFSDETLRGELEEKGWFLSSANSINWGRVLPQIVYYVSAYCDLVEQGRIQNGETVNVCVPTGNFGNILAAYYAKQMGVPLGKLLCASNRNNVLTDFIQTGVYDRKRQFYNTLSPSMDILISSNLERLLYALSGRDDAYVASCMSELNRTGAYRLREDLRGALQEQFYAAFCDDTQTKEVIAGLWAKHRYLIDPHTAVAFEALNRYRRETGDTAKTLVVSTASPFKFCDSVLDALGVDASAQKSGLDLLDQLGTLAALTPPAPLAALRDKAVRFTGVVDKTEMRAFVRDALG